MKRLQLPDVTLVAIETLDHELTRLAIRDCLRHVEFGSIVVISDQRLCDEQHYWMTPPIDIRCPHDYSATLWHHVWPHVKTSHFLLVQWDSWIIDPGMWNPEFLEYDYIGPPWWHNDGSNNVGSGGFCLRSTRLMEYVSSHPEEFPLVDPEDIQLSRIYYPRLKEAGFKWPRAELAHDFAFETNRGTVSGGTLFAAPRCRHFGFHALRNWPLVLDEFELTKRLAIFDPSRKSRESEMFHLKNNLMGLKKLGRKAGYRYKDQEVIDTDRPQPETLTLSDDGLTQSWFALPKETPQ